MIDDNFGKSLVQSSSKIGLSYDDIFHEDFFFDMDSYDVMVFLHMQKTGKHINLNTSVLVTSKKLGSNPVTIFNEFNQP